ncbi:MAG: porin, partial [Pseudomonadota bacterium]
MNGGLKSISAAAMFAAAASLGGLSAQAADLGGNCCADLEERIAELEATTARKGTRVMSLKISGSVSARVVYHDSDGLDAHRPDKVSIEDYDDGGDLRFSGTAKLNSDISAGFRMSFDPNDDQSNPVDDLYLTIKSKTFGTVDIGRVDSAFDGINRISLANIEDIMLDDAGLDGVGNGPNGYVGEGYFNFVDLDGDDAEGGTIRYTSPTVAGFIFSASYSTDADEANFDAGDEFDSEEIWAVALRYAGEFGAFRVAAGIGYEEQSADSDLDDDVDVDIVTGSISVMHSPTGLFVNFAAGERTTSVEGEDDVELLHYGVVLGIEQKWFSVGKSTFYGHVNWGEEDDGDDDVDGMDWGIGFVQN